MADFSTTEEWDPGIPSARRLDDRPIGLGSRFELLSRFGSTEQTIVYEITAYDPPNSVTFVGDGKRFRGTDVISFAPPGRRHPRDLRGRPGAEGAVVPRPAVHPGRLDEMSDRAVAGLKTALDARA